MAIPPLLPLPNLELGRVSRLGLALLVVGLSMVMFSAYMLASSVQQSRKISMLVDQTQVLRQELANDHLWQVTHHVMLEHLERLVRASVLRKEALIRGVVKRRYNWSDEDVKSAIESEIGNVSADDDSVIVGPDPSSSPSPPSPPSPPLPGGSGRESPR